MLHSEDSVRNDISGVIISIKLFRRRLLRRRLLAMTFRVSSFYQSRCSGGDCFLEDSVRNDVFQRHIVIVLLFRQHDRTTAQPHENLYRGPDSNRHGNKFPQDFKSCASTNSATPASIAFNNKPANIENHPFFCKKIDSLGSQIITNLASRTPLPGPRCVNLIPESTLLIANNCIYFEFLNEMTMPGG